MDDFFDAVEFLREEDEFISQPVFNEDSTGINEEINLFAKSFQEENALPPNCRDKAQSVIFSLPA